MGENTNQIEREIVAERDRLGRNLNELETKTQQLADWQTHYRNNPKLALGIALTGGLMLGAMAGRGRPSGTDGAGGTIARLPRPQSRLSRQIEHTWLSLSDALLGVAAAKVLAVVSGVVPGFRERSTAPHPVSATTRRDP